MVSSMCWIGLTGELLRANKYVTATWATHVDMTTGRPVEDPAYDYLDKTKWILPGTIRWSQTGRLWRLIRKRRLVFIPAMENPPGLCHGMKNGKNTGVYKHVVGGWNTGVELGNIIQVMGQDGIPPKARGYLKAFDPLTGEEKWAVEQVHHWNGGTLATEGGLVFQG